jgi:hypothetical protein
MWQRAQREAEALAGADMKIVLEELAPYQDPHILWSAAEASLVPVIPFTMDIQGLKISMFAVVATFGTAQDITADELRLETLFPADPETEAMFRAAAQARIQ